MAQNKAMANTHAKRYIESVFEQRLREEGFVCSNDKFLCWYRVKNGEILNFITMHSVVSNAIKLIIFMIALIGVIYYARRKATHFGITTSISMLFLGEIVSSTCWIYLYIQKLRPAINSENVLRITNALRYVEAAKSIILEIMLIIALLIMSKRTKQDKT